MSLYVAKGSPDLEISSTELQSLLFEVLAELGERRHALAVPPDLARRDPPHRRVDPLRIRPLRQPTRSHISWCPGRLTREEVEGVGFAYGDRKAMFSHYDPAKLQHGYNTVDDKKMFFIANPGLGLWVYRGRF
jgi:hypothetical protein